ncbi:thioredoxin family protein [Thiolinea disciformis]|uniref:thioredoxin family protein n=1 Tax=Thiolinea disciformis TaxID=125614 RepID=UPI00039C6320|nr:thioredoxin fold domain-containing protein [Thiolinea disciformis]
MKVLLAMSLMLVVGMSFAAQPTKQLESGMVNPGYQEKPTWFKESFLDLREDIAEAKAANKRVMLYFYQDGCPYCTKLLRDNFGQTSIAEFTQQHFDVIALNMWGDKEVTDLAGKKLSEKEFAKQLKVQFTPTLLFLDESGQSVLRANGYYAPDKFRVALQYVADKQESKAGFVDYLAKQQTDLSSQLASIPASLPQPLKLKTGRSHKPLLLLFESEDCGAPCIELREIFKRKEVAIALSNFELASVNPHADTRLETPAGKDMTAKDWAKTLGIHYSPSLVFFDSDGQEVFRNEAYLKAFHVHGALDYVATQAYRWQPEFQRFLQQRREILQARGLAVDLLE